MPRQLRLLGSLGAAALLLGFIISHAAAGPQPVDRPLNVTGSEGLFAVSLPDTSNSALALSRKSERRTLKAFKRWLTTATHDQLQTALPGRKVARAEKLIVKLITRQLDGQQTRGSARTALAPGESRLNALSLYSTFTVVGLNLNESLSAKFNLAGKEYAALLTERTMQAAGDGLTLQIDYTAVPTGDSVNGTLFAAVVRETTLPSTGVLVIATVDSELSERLDGLGATNTDAAGTPLNIPYQLELDGVTSGAHVADGPSFDVLYFAKSGVAGIGVPEELAEAVAQLLLQISGG